MKQTVKEDISVNVDKPKETSRLDKCQIKITFQYIYDTINPRKNGKPMNQEDFVATVVPNDLAKIIGNNQSACTRLFQCKDGMAKRFGEFRDLLLELEETKNPYSVVNNSIKQEMIQCWDSFLDVQQVDKEVLSHSIQKILETQIEPEENGPRVKEAIQELLRKGKLSEALTSLSLIASTLFCWNDAAASNANGDCKNKGKNQKLYDLVLPLSDKALAASYIDKAIHEIETATDLNTSNPAFCYLKDAIQCGDEVAQGKAYYWLSVAYARCGDEKCSRLQLEKSADTGYELAQNILNDYRANEKATAQLAKAEERFLVSPLHDCYKICKDILEMKPSDLAIIGKASWLAYQCVKRSPNWNEDPDPYLAQSRDCGCEEARLEWDRKSTVIPSLEQSSDKDKGIYFFNANNQMSTQIQQTAPSGWNMRESWYVLNDKDGACEQKLKYFLIDDSQVRNFHDALRLLQAIQNDEDFCNRKIELYVRGDSEYLYPLIDTALSHMETPIPIYIIDDNLWPAQWLLSRHPLFYPIRFLRATQEAILHLVIVGNTKRMEWLVREAFALLGFEGRRVRCKITTIAPNAAEIQEKLRFRCQGIFEDTLTKGIRKAELSFETCGSSFHTTELKERLISLYQEQNSNCYFVLDTGDEAETLSLSVKLRESLIRSIIFGKVGDKKQRLNSLPPIAFFCEDPFVAHLSKSMVFDLEDYGNQWFNSPCLIPFGVSTDRYTWDNIAGGMFEHFSEIINLQYGYISKVTEKIAKKATSGEVNRAHVTLLPEELGELKKAALNEYFRRAYNHDSSLAMAISLPYRLFQFEAAKSTEPVTSTARHLVPLHWRIIDPDAYCSERQLAALSKSLKEFLDSLQVEQRKSRIDDVAKWEHDRWSRWMLSRGWLSEGQTDATDCVKFGNKRHQLYIAKLHPCICEYGQLSFLAQWLKTKCEMEKDFISLDKESVAKTENIFSLKWHDEYSDKEVEH